MDEIDRLALGTRCPYCGQAAGEWCVTRTTRRQAQWLHAARTGPFFDFWRSAYQEGQEHVVAVIDRWKDSDDRKWQDWLDRFLAGIRARTRERERREQQP